MLPWVPAKLWSAREIGEDSTVYKRSETAPETEIVWFIQTAGGDPFMIYDELSKQGFDIDATFVVEDGEFFGRWTNANGAEEFERSEVPDDLKALYADYFEEEELEELLLF